LALCVQPLFDIVSAACEASSVSRIVTMTRRRLPLHLIRRISLLHARHGAPLFAVFAALINENAHSSNSVLYQLQLSRTFIQFTQKEKEEA
jgi:hypothetical protein